MENLAKLAMLDISDAENLQQDIGEIIQMAEILSEVTAEAYVNNSESAFRQDEPIQSFGREDMLINAPYVKDGFIIVPKTVG